MDFQTIPATHLQQPQLQPFINHRLELGSIAEEHAYNVDVKTEQFARSDDSHSNSDGPSPDSNLPPHKRARINYECDACGTTYTEKRALARHRHTDMHRRRLGLQPDKRHLCLKCGRSFGRNHDLQRHRREQHGEATGANPIDLSSVASDASEHRSLSSDESGKSLGGHSWTSTMTAMTIPDELPPQYKLRGTRSMADIRKKSDDAKSSRSGSMDWSHTPIKVEASPTMTTIKPWPGEPAEEEHTMQGIMQPPSKLTKKPARRHSSASIRDEKLPPPPTVSISPPESVSSRPSSSRSRHTSRSRPSLSKESSRNEADDVLDKILNPKSKSRRLREKVVTSSIPVDPRHVESWLSDPMTCAVCDERFVDDDTLLDHLKQHMESFKGKHKCNICKIGFDHEEDLEMHLESAKRGHCGFEFEHIHPCTGHHPPLKEVKEGEEDRLSDPDCFRLCQKLWHWEQAQLQAYIAIINKFVAEREQRRKNRWSVEALMRKSKRNSSHSFSSFAISVNTYASAPCDETNGHMDISGLQKRMKIMTLGSNIKHLMGGGKYHPTKPLPPPSPIYDKTLYRAICKGDLKKAENLLNSGEADAALSRASGNTTAGALWDADEIRNTSAAHRISEDIQGSCDVCKMTSATFEKGTNKVKALLLHGASPSQPGGLCGFPILSAAWLCNDEVIEILLEKGANVNQRDKDGKFGSPLAVAASQAGHEGSLEVVGVLLKNRANVDIRGAEGSPLHLAKTRKSFWETSAEIMLKMSAEEVATRVNCCNQIIKALELAGARR